MIFGMQRCRSSSNMGAIDPIIIEGVIAVGLRKLLENEFLFIFSMMVRWIQMIFNIQVYHEEMQVELE
jgi:hypothetical protein